MDRKIVKFQDIEDLLSFTLNNVFLDKNLVDEDGYVLQTNGDKLEINNSNVVILSEIIKDTEASVLNPFLNERKISSQLNYYYKTLSTSILIKLIILMNEILQKAYHFNEHSKLGSVKEKTRYIKDNKCNLNISLKYNDLISVVGNLINENTLKQFKIFQSNTQSKRIENVCYFGYNIKEEESKFYITYLKEKELFKGGVNNNNIKIIRDLTLKILCDDDESFLEEIASEKTHSKRYDSIIKLYFKINKRFNAIINSLDNESYKEMILDEDEIDRHLENLDEYSKLGHSRIFISHKNAQSTSSPTFSDNNKSIKESHVIYDSMGNPINMKRENMFKSSGPDRTYDGPQFPNIVAVSDTIMRRPMYNNNMMMRNQQPMFSNNRSMFQNQNMGGMVDFNQALY